MVRNLMGGEEGDLDHTIDKAMNRVRQDFKRGAGPVDEEKVASATEKAMTRWMDALKSTSEAVLYADVTRDKLTIAAKGEAVPGGRLAALIERQEPGMPFGYKLLPADSWLVVADHGNEEAIAEGKETWQPVYRDLLDSLPEKMRERLVSALGDATGSFTGDITMAAHSPEGGEGMTVSAAARVKDGDQAKKAVKELASALGAWLKQSIKSSTQEIPPGVKVERQPLAFGDATGELFEFYLPVKKDRRQALAHSVGLPITLGIVFHGDHALISAGKGARAQLEKMAAGIEAGTVDGSLGEREAFKQAMKASENRVGLLYVSVVDLIRWLDGGGFTDVSSIASALGDDEVKTAPSLDWGVDEEKKHLDFTLRIPADHFEPFKPVIEKMKQRGGPPLR
jgi:hypothetical protein